jgi:hypothetical protein
MNELITHGVTFLIGTATGAAGAYFADKFTDQRRSKEGEKITTKRFKKIEAQMSDLISEIREDLSTPKCELFRDCFVVNKGAQLWASEGSFIYRDDGENNYFSKMKILETSGYIYDITPKNAQMYRFTEEFVELIKM